MLPGIHMFDPLLSTGRLWLIGLILIAACLLAREAGMLIYRRVKKGNEEEAKEADETESHTIGTIFGLLAFILAFTFSIALDRYDTRRTLVAEEANAIGTTYRRASLFDEPDRSGMQATLRQYARTRITPVGLPSDEMEERVRQSNALREKFWTEARAAIWPVRDTERGSYFVESVNEMIEIGNRREVAGRAHVPTSILDVTLVYLLVSAAVLGYMQRGKKGGRKASTALLILFVMVIILILDLDQPRTGTITVSQRAMEDMVAALEADAAIAPAPPTVGPPP